MRQFMRQLTMTLMMAAVALSSYAFANGPIGVMIHGERVEISPAVQIDDGVLLGAPASIVGRLGCRFMAAEGEALLIITPAGRRVTVTPGEDTIRVDGIALKMPRPAILAAGRLVAPIRPVIEAIGAVPHWNPRTRVLDIGVPLEALTVHADASGARVALKAPLRVQGNLSHVSNPERYYVDLPGVWVKLEHEQTYVSEGNLLRVRAGQFKQDPPVARVVVDMREGATVRWQPGGEGLGGEFLIDDHTGDKPLIERRLPQVKRLLASSPDRDTTIIRMELSDVIEAQYDVQLQPARVTVTLPDAAPAAQLPPIEVESPFVRQAQIKGQPGAAGTTLTLQMHQLIHFEVQSSHDPPAVNVVFRRGSLADRRIVIDPGHGGRDPGAVGRVLKEKEVNLDVAQRVASKLMARGVQTTLTRETDVFIELLERPRMANRIGAELFVSIHANAMPRRNTGRGIETYYYNAYSKCLGLIMQTQLVHKLGRRDNGLRRANFAVIRETRMPGVLVELMYLNNDEEEALLARPEVREAAADAIVEGLRQYVEGTGSIVDSTSLGM